VTIEEGEGGEEGGARGVGEGEGEDKYAATLRNTSFLKYEDEDRLSSRD